ncbi:MAG: AraC family transcriptional regulator [Cyclobacteriaceae bacterium]|nr:AraC family transcriptional regulator [Cyclobacteriaceae bacterium]
MVKPKTEPSRGLLNKSEGENHFQLSRFEPTTSLAGFVEHYWIVRWDLSGKNPYEQEVLAHPSVHLVFEKSKTRIWGVVTGKFTRVIKDKGCVLGIKFKPGGFYPFYKNDISSFSDSMLPFHLAFNDDLTKLEGKILQPTDEKEMIELAEQFLLRNLPEPDPNVDKVNEIMEFVKKDSEILKVDDLVERFKYSKRTLQRLFKHYVGVSPKWVIMRYRLHDVAERIAAKPVTNWAALALEAGYFDQAHFIRDFKSIVGKTPAEYAEGLKWE